MSDASGDDLLLRHLVANLNGRLCQDLNCGHTIVFVSTLVFSGCARFNDISRRPLGFRRASRRYTPPIARMPRPAK